MTQQGQNKKNYLILGDFHKIFENSMLKITMGSGHHLTRICYTNRNIKTCSNIGKFVSTW